MKVTLAMSALSALLPVTWFACALFTPEDPDTPTDSLVTEIGAGDEGDNTEWMAGWPDKPPAELPLALIVSQDADREAIAEGVPYYVQWFAQDESQSDHDMDLNDLLSDIMPPPVRLGAERSLRIMTNSRSYLIMVAGFDELSPADETQSDFDESGFWECGRSDRNPCERISPEGFLEYHVPPAVFQHRYMSVFAMWSVPPTIVDDEIIPPEGPDFVQANWLFHLLDE